MPSINCPSCGLGMRLITSDRYKYKNGHPKRYYQCIDWPRCRGNHGAHPNGQPVGIPAEKGVRQISTYAPILREEIWDYNDRDQRDEMYVWLATNASKQHIGDMNEDECWEM